MYKFLWLIIGILVACNLVMFFNTDTPMSILIGGAVGVPAGWIGASRDDR